MKIPLMLLINGCKNGQDVVEDCLVASSITQEREKEAKDESTISYLQYVRHVFVLHALDYSLRLLYPLILTI